MTSLTDLCEMSVHTGLISRCGRDVRAHRLRVVAIVERRRIRATLDGRVVNDLVDEVCGDTGADMGRSDVENFTRELQTFPTNAAYDKK